MTLQEIPNENANRSLLVFERCNGCGRPFYLNPSTADSDQENAWVATAIELTSGTCDACSYEMLEEKIMEDIGFAETTLDRVLRYSKNYPTAYQSRARLIHGHLRAIVTAMAELDEIKSNER